MSGKFVLFFLVALCTAQSFEARNVETRGLIQNIINDIKQIIKNVEEGVHDLISNIPNLLKKLDEKINEIIDKVIKDATNVISVINNQVEKILAAAGLDLAAGKTCIEAEKSDVDQLIKDTTDAVEACRKTADERKEELNQEMEKLKTKALDTIKEINSGLAQCLHDHALNPIKLTQCLTGHLGAVKVKADALLVQIKDTIFVANKTAADVAITVAKCTANINVNLLSGQKKILENFKKCVDDIKSKQ